ncbi:MAG TPA: hypothetical protein VGA36_06720 [Nitriliruptorales bacterium]
MTDEPSPADADDDQSSTTAASDDPTADEPSPEAGNPVTSLLEDLDVLDSVSSLDMRVLDIEQRVRKVAERVDQAGRRQVGELDVMRARISDMVELIRESGREREEALARLDTDLATLLDERVTSLMAQITATREEVATQTQGALTRLDDAVATLRGEATAAGEASARQLEAVTSRIEEVIASLADREAAATAALTAEGETRRNDNEALEKRLNGRLDVAAEAAADARHRLDERIEALRRELDATSGELRAHVVVALGDLTTRVDDLGERLDTTIRDAPDWQQLSRDLAARDDEVERRLRDAIRDESANRMGAVDDLADQVADALRTARDALDRDVAEQVRAATDADRLATTVQAISARLTALQSTLAHALNDVASGLSDRVAGLGGQLDGVRESAARTQERLAMLDRLDARLDHIEAAQQDRGRDHELADQLAELQRELGRMNGRIDSFARQAAAADERAEALRRDVGVLGDELAAAGAWRSELRDLTSRTSELAARLAEAETIARRAGNAVVEAVRAARSEEAARQERRDDVGPLFPD